MKKFIYIIFLALLAACTHQELPEQPGAVKEGEPVTLTFSVKVPDTQSAALRGTLGKPSITDLQLVVFDANGALRQVAVATPTSGWTVSEDSETEFTVTLNQTSQKRIIHFVANYDATKVQWGNESAVMRGMSVSGGMDAYWQRVEFERGIAEGMTGGMKPVHLVRNFAKITMNADAVSGKFTLTGFAVVNTPTMGSVAAYNTNGGGFAEYWSGSGNTPKSFTEINGTQGFKGFMPADAQMGNTNVQNPEFHTEAFYMYEHPYPGNTTATYVLVKGQYQGGADSYYKLDIVQKDEAGVATPLDIIRNFEYAFQITDVTGDGYNTAEEAAKNPASNNLSASVETKNLLNISDGTSRLFVNFTDTTLVNTNVIKLKYKYIPQISSGAVDNSQVRTDRVVPGNVIASVGSSASEGDWNVLLITPKEPGTVMQQQSVILYVENGLSREVNFTLRQALALTVGCFADEGRTSSEVEGYIGAPLWVDVTIPNDISESLFPLEFLVECDALSIYPNAAKDYMPTRVGKSIVTGKESQSFAFVKTITWEDFNNATVCVPNESGKTKTFTCHFLTNKAASAGTVYVYNKYFNLGLDGFTNSEKTFTIPQGALTAGGSFSYGWNSSTRTVSIYSDSSLKDKLGECTFSEDNNKRNNSSITLKIPVGVEMLYFSYTSQRTTYKAQASVSALKNAENSNGQRVTLSFSQQ